MTLPVLHQNVHVEMGNSDDVKQSLLYICSIEALIAACNMVSSSC